MFYIINASRLPNTPRQYIGCTYVYTYTYTCMHTLKYKQLPDCRDVVCDDDDDDGDGIRFTKFNKQRFTKNLSRVMLIDPFARAGRT